MISVGILIYPVVEVLDFCGPFEVFRNASRMYKEDKIEVFTVSASINPIDAQGLTVIPSHSFDSCPKLDILIIPGGAGVWLTQQENYQEFVLSRFSDLDHLLTVCTGALLPAKIGLLKENYDATTHQEGMDLLRQLAPNANILPTVRFTHSENIVMSGGISAGIDGSLYLVSQLLGEKLAEKVALYMEYDWRIRRPNEEDPSIIQL